MSPHLPGVTGRQAIRALMRLGFVVERIVGSHHMLVHRDDPSKAVTVPVHAGRDLKPGTLRSISRQAGVAVDDFRAQL